MVYPAQKRHRWRSIGWGRHDDHAHRVYAALVPLVCAGCGRDILPGEHFTRHRRAGPHSTAVPYCGVWRPFSEVGA